MLNGDGVLPAEIAWREADKDRWHTLKKEVIYQLGGKTSEPVPLPGGLVEAVKIKTLNARLPENLPGVTGQRVRYDLVFNAQGKAVPARVGERGCETGERGDGYADPDRTA